MGQPCRALSHSQCGVGYQSEQDCFNKGDNHRSGRFTAVDVLKSCSL